MSDNGFEYFVRALYAEDTAALRALDLQCFPIQYDAKFYDMLFRSASSLRSIAFGAFEGSPSCPGKLVGAVTGRLVIERPSFLKALKAAYIMTLDVDPNFRRHGIAATLLDKIKAFFVVHHDVDRLLLHVLQANDPALRFYDRMGFSSGPVIPNYYVIHGQHENGIVMFKDISRRSSRGIIYAVYSWIASSISRINLFQKGCFGDELDMDEEETITA